MCTVHMSRGLSVSKATTYFLRDFAAEASLSYYPAHQALQSEWHGALAAQLGLIGSVDAPSFQRLADGRDPNARYDPAELRGWVREHGEYLLRTNRGETLSRVSKDGPYWRRSDAPNESYRTAASAQNAAQLEAVGQWVEHQDTLSQKTRHALKHRAGIDIVFNFDKSISVTGVHDSRVYEAAFRAARAGLDAMEQSVQARGGGNHPAETTGQWITALFPHTTARPERTTIHGETLDYSAPHFHVHGFWLNLAQDATGQFRAVQPRAMYDAQKYGAAVANSVLALELKRLGYEIEQGTNHAVTMAGYDPEYLRMHSPRSEQINKTVSASGYRGRRAEEIIAHRYRQEKEERPTAEIQEDYRRIAAASGNPQKLILETAKLRSDQTWTQTITANEALTWAKEKLSYRNDVFTERELLTEALWVSQGQVGPQELHRELGRRAQSALEHEHGIPKEFMRAPHAMGVSEPGMRYTTHEAQEYERRAIRIVQDGFGNSVPVLPEATTRAEIHERFAHLNHGSGINYQQAQAIWEQATTRDRVTGIRGAAGVGKSSSVLLPVQNLYKEAGYQVLAAAPSGKARQELEKAGIEKTITLQKLALVDAAWLKRNKGIDPLKPLLLLIDEAGLAPTRMLVTVLNLRLQDRTILSGDTRQHEAVEAGRTFELLIQAGMQTSDLDLILRQKPDWYLRAVERMQAGKMGRALDLLHEHGNVQIHQKPAERIRRLAERYAEHPERTYAVSATNEGRKQINQAVREVLRERNLLAPDTVMHAQIYVPRQELTPADLRIAAQYRVGDILTYQAGYRTLGVTRGQQGEIVRRNPDATNPWVEVKLYGKTGPGATLRYNPETVNKISVYERQSRALAVGDQIVLKKKWKGLENGDRVTVLELESNGNVKVQAKGKEEQPGRVLVFNLHRMPHWDHGYASTSYSIQGATEEYVLVDAATLGKKESAALSQAFLYVGGSRGRLGVEVFTDDLERLKTLLAEPREKAKALSPKAIEEERLKVQPVRPGHQPRISPPLPGPVPGRIRYGL